MKLGSADIAPVEAVSEVMYPTGHAFAVRCENGMGILVHIGIDTVRLKGKGFKVFAKQGEKVKAGQKLVEVNLELVKDAGYDVTCMMIITEPIQEERIRFTCGSSVKRGQIINK
ncbi:MAG: PTS glucose transporter subunit IIA [Erysipelotrichaceae bacterium]|nr:PTS glucose transporter subunit IIA [Erysipelotrichaceae bacterium]